MGFAYELPLWWERTFPMLAEGLRSPDFDGLLLLRWTLQCLAISLPIFLADYLLGAGLLYTLSRRRAPSPKTSSPPSPLPSARLNAIRSGAGIGNR